MPKNPEANIDLQATAIAKLLKSHPTNPFRCQLGGNEYSSVLRWDTIGVNVEAQEVRELLDVQSALIHTIRTVRPPKQEGGKERVVKTEKVVDRACVVNIEGARDEQAANENLQRKI